MKKILPISLSVFFFGILCPILPKAQAFQLYGQRWSGQSTTYYNNLSVGSAMDDAAALAAAVDTWNDDGDALFMLLDGGLAADATYQTSNSLNTVVSLTGGAPTLTGNYLCSTGTGGTNFFGFTTRWYSSGIHSDAVIVICEDRYNMTTGLFVPVSWNSGLGIPTASQVDLASILAHEIGHLQGLEHSCDFTVGNAVPDCPTPSCDNPTSPLSEATMCSRSALGSIAKRDIAADDAAGLQAIYGAGEVDPDGDNLPNANDNCPNDANPDQTNTDGDTEGDICDLDDDNDGDNDGSDNCPLIANASQANYDGDSEGDACDNDDDNDGVWDAADACPLNPNDTIGDPCNHNDCSDFTPQDPIGSPCNHDEDGDGVLDTADACPTDPNDTIGNPCNHNDCADFSPRDTVGDACIHNDCSDFTLQDPIGNACNHDEDGDGVLDIADNCPFVANPTQTNTDTDLLGNACDADNCTGVIVNDSNVCTTDSCDIATGNVQHVAISMDDNDVCTADSCHPITGVQHTPISLDDGDTCTLDLCDPINGISHVAITVEDDSDVCTLDSCNPTLGMVHAPLADSDGDLFCDIADNCPSIANEDQANMDNDSFGNFCDTDIDGDGFLNNHDEFPLLASEWWDTDCDTIGNNTDTDDDNDGILDTADAFPLSSCNSTSWFCRMSSQLRLSCSSREILKWRPSQIRHQLRPSLFQP